MTDNKLYLFYLLSEQRLYAYTTNKEFKKLFMSQRNMKLFKVTTKLVDDTNLSIFMYQNRKLMLVSLPLYDGKNDIMIIGTIEEDDRLSESCEKIDSDMYYLKQELINNIPFNDKYLNLIERLTNIIKKEKRKIPLNNSEYEFILEINTFSLFYHLFKNTFSDNSTLDENDLIL